MKIALIQMNSGPDKKNNIEKAIAYVKIAESNGAKFILLPEVFNYRGAINNLSNLKGIAEEIPGKSTIQFLNIAKKKNIFLLLGSIYEKNEKYEKAFNTSIIIDDNGDIKGVYRKIHLFDAIVGKQSAKETEIFKPGQSPVIVKVEGYKIGLSICYDLRFPDLYKYYFENGVEIFCLPSSFTAITGKAHWEVLLRARAIENLCYILAPNQIGIDGNGIESFGNSMIVNPWGQIEARASSNKEEIIYSNVERNKIESARKRLPKIIIRDL